MSCLALYSRETLCKVTQNDPSLKILTLFNYDRYDGVDGDFYSGNSDDYSTLGAAIANNTHLVRLKVILTNRLALGVTNREFIDGLQRNSSIHKLILVGDTTRQNIARNVGQVILQAYQNNNSQLTVLSIIDANLRNGGDRVIVDTLRNCINLQSILLNNCNITDAQLLPIVNAIRGHRMLETLDLYGNDIGNAGCDAIATLLIDPISNIRTLYLERNAITAEGATVIANSLTNNTKLQKLWVGHNQFGQSDVVDAFCNLLCSTSNINNTHSSNHALEWSRWLMMSWLTMRMSS